jgi:hypothetical protein
MGPRAALNRPTSALVLAALSAALLIGCDDGGSGFPGADLAMPGSDFGVFYDASFCTSNIVITANPAPPGVTSFAYAPTDLFATTKSPGLLETPSWTVSLADGATFLPEVVDTQSGLSVKFHAAVPGSYRFQVSFGAAQACPGANSFDVISESAKQLNYRLRVSPPDTAGVPQQDTVITVYGGTKKGDADIHLSPGTPLSGTLKGTGGSGTAGEIRFIADSGPDALATAGSSGAFALAMSPDSYYTPLLIPSSLSLAPALLGRATGATLAAGAFVVDAGQTVSGAVTDPSDSAIAGVRLVLRNGKLPSGVGLSASDGSYSLHAEPGSYVAQVGADGWPELSLSGVSVPQAALSLDVKYLVSRVAVTGKVLASDGTTAVGGARVTIRSPQLSGVATVNVGGTPETCDGHINQVVVAGADGTLPSLLLPPLASGSYQVLVEPPAGAADGMTLLSLPLSSASNWNLVLAPKILLSGNVKDLLGQGVGDVRVTAFETAGLGAAPWTMTTSDGRYMMKVDPGSPITLLAEPPGAAQLVSARLSLPAGATQADVALAPGLLIGGTVYAPGGGTLPSVVVDALCSTCGSTTPIASALSDASGLYKLYLPDPGLNVPDGGFVDGGGDASP